MKTVSFRFQQQAGFHNKLLLLYVLLWLAFFFLFFWIFELFFKFYYLILDLFFIKLSHFYNMGRGFDELTRLI
jgi:hypothetical protein